MALPWGNLNSGFATVAFRVGLDLKDIRQIIHVGQ